MKSLNIQFPEDENLIVSRWSTRVNFPVKNIHWEKQFFESFKSVALSYCCVMLTLYENFSSCLISDYFNIERIGVWKNRNSLIQECFSILQAKRLINFLRLLQPKLWSRDISFKTKIAKKRAKQRREKRERHFEEEFNRRYGETS